MTNGPFRQLQMILSQIFNEFRCWKCVSMVVCGLEDPLLSELQM